MPNYTKLFNSIVTSTIWTEDDKTRIVWITMLAMSDQNGEVHASVPGLARVSGVSLYDCESALVKLSSPDAYSRTPDHQGRRISPIDGGWELLNHRKYRAMASREDEKKANADRQKRHRERNATVTDSNAAVTLCNDEVTESLHIVYTEADTEADTDTEVDTKQKKPKLVQSPTALEGFEEFWKAYPKKQGKEPARKAWMRDKPDIQKVIKALEWQKCDDQWIKEGGQYIPLPASYLNAKRYDDESPSTAEIKSDYVNVQNMTPEERIIHYRKGYPERDWPFIMEDGYLDLIAKGLHIKAAKEEARRISEGIEPDDLEPTPKGELW